MLTLTLIGMRNSHLSNQFCLLQINQRMIFDDHNKIWMIANEIKVIADVETLFIWLDTTRLSISYLNGMKVPFGWTWRRHSICSVGRNKDGVSVASWHFF